MPDTAALVERLRNLLLTNLGCDLKGDADAAMSRRQRLAAAPGISLTFPAFFR